MTFVVVDRSASMRAGTRWDDAVAEAISALESAVENSSKVQLFDFAADLTARSEPTADVSHAINVLRALAPSFERAAYGVTMQQLDTLASRQTVPVEVVMITDIQSSNLPLQRRLLRTQHIDQLNLKTIHGDDQNMAVRASASSKDGVNVRVNAQVLLSQTTAAELNRAAELRVRAGEKLLATESLRLSANTIESLTLNDLILPSAETHTLSVDVVAAESDDLQEDSSVDVPIRRTAPIPVGLLRLNNDQAEAAMLYLRRCRCEPLTVQSRETLDRFLSA